MAQTRCAAGSQSGGGDYFVPWHVPFHRVDAAAAAAKALPGDVARQQGDASIVDSHPQPACHQPADSGAAAHAPACLKVAEQVGGEQDVQEGRATGASRDAAQAEENVPCLGSEPAGGRPNTSEVFRDGRVDEAKRTVVFKRYYHLYDQGELEGLVEQVRCVKLVSSFFDKSNWCAIFEKV